MPDFKQTKPDGTPYTCKFCRQPVWFDRDSSRVYEIGGEALHVKNCPQRQAHFKNVAQDAAEARRQRRQRDT